MIPLASADARSDRPATTGLLRRQNQLAIKVGNPNRSTPLRVTNVGRERSSGYSPASPAQTITMSLQQSQSLQTHRDRPVDYASEVNGVALRLSKGLKPCLTEA